MTSFCDVDIENVILFVKYIFQTYENYALLKRDSRQKLMKAVYVGSKRFFVSTLM